MGVKCRCTRETRNGRELALRAFRGFFEGNGLKADKRASGSMRAWEAHLLFAHRGNDGNEEVFTLVKSTRDLSAKFTLRNLDIVLRSAIRGHQVKKPVINVDLDGSSAAWIGD